MDKELGETRSIIEAWERIKDRLGDFPIPRIQEPYYSDDEMKWMLKQMRKRIIWAEQHPTEDDPYEALGKDYQDFYSIMQSLADYRGIVVGDEPEG